QLDTLQRSLAGASAADFGGDPGAWLLARATPAAANARLPQDIQGARSPTEVRAALAMAVPSFNGVDPTSQSRLAAALFEARSSPEGLAGFRRLIENGDFRDLP